MKLAWLFLLLVPLAGAWPQEGGDAARGGVADVPLQALDVVSIEALDGPVHGVLGTPAGLSWLTGSGTCQLTTPLGTARMPCGQSPSYAGWSDALGLHLVCADQAYAFDATGNEVWTVAAPTTPTGQWSCVGALGTAAYLAWSDGASGHRIQAVTQGELDWDMQLPLDAFVAGMPPETAVPLEVIGALAGANFAPTSVTVDTHVLVLGRSDNTPAFAWLDLDGTFGGAAQVPGDGLAGQTPPMSRHATTRDDMHAWVMGSQLLVLDPTQDAYSATDIGSLALSASQLAAPAWGSQVLMIPSEAGALLIDARDPTDVARWGGISGSSLQGAVLGQNGEAFAFVTGPKGGTVVRFDTSTGYLLDRVPVPLTAEPGGMLPTPTGLAIWDQDTIARLEPRGGGPRVFVDNQYPDVASVVSVSVTGDAQAFWLSWGDGFSQKIQPGTHKHTYEAAGSVNIRVTAVDSGNLTRTSEQVVHVGGTPPKPANVIAEAFSEDNWEKTVTIGGITVSLIGALLGFLGATKGRRRLERELRILDGLRDDGRSDAISATGAVHAYRQRIREDTAKGRLAEGQFNVLETRARETLDGLRDRVLGHLAADVSPRFQKLLDITLRDGRVDAEEADLLREAVGQEKVSAARRTQLLDLVNSWVG